MLAPVIAGHFWCPAECDVDKFVEANRSGTKELINLALYVLDEIFICGSGHFNVGFPASAIFTGLLPPCDTTA